MSIKASTELPETPPRETALQVKGMTCANCARHVTEALQEVPGVSSVNVSLEAQSARVKWRPETPADAAPLVQAVREAGYEATPVETVEAPRLDWRARLNSWGFTVLLGSAALLPLVIGEWIFHWAHERWFQWLGFALALPVQVLGGARFYMGAWRQLKKGQSNMDTLVALGSTTAFVYSVYVLFSGTATHVYFMEAAGIITLISLGHWIEGRAIQKASSSLKALLNLAPSTARKLVHSQEKIVPIAELDSGDRVLLKPGDRVPTDGKVVSGTSAVDESMLTGESLPVDKKAGNQIYAGTVNLNGQIIMQVTATGESTALAHIIASVHRAQTSRAAIQRLADKVSSVFVPIVILVAIGAALWWGLAPAQARAAHEFLSLYLWDISLPETALAAALVHLAAVLIIACPCAMGLATPVAIMAGSDAASRRGILIRDGIALEKAGSVSAVLFDKTGTLTRGKPKVVGSEVFSDTLASSCHSELRLASSLAKNSTHPLSQAVATLPSHSVPMEDWREVRGRGVQARVETAPGHREIARLGSLNWLAQEKVKLGMGKAFSEKWMESGATVLGLSIGDTLAAAIALQDTLKPGADEVVRQLRERKLHLYMITGDNARTAASIAKMVGIDPENVFAETAPERKAEIVQELQRRGERVAFIGDGINDAPALEQADLAIAVSKASDVAREAADVILLNSEIHAIPETLGLAQATLRTIKQNLFWAFFYNAAGVPLAALGFLSPVVCAAAMGLSDLVVIGNALRLRRWTFRGKN